MNQSAPQAELARRESGFTLVEALVAILVLSVGIMAVTNLMVVASSSTSAANQSTAAAASATQVLDILRATPYATLRAELGGDLDADVGPASDCLDLGTAAFAVGDSYQCDSEISGVGLVHNRWRISPTLEGPRTLFLEVRSEGTGVLGAGRSRAYFTTFRSCTDSRTGLPAAARCPE